MKDKLFAKANLRIHVKVISTNNLFLFWTNEQKKHSGFNSIQKSKFVIFDRYTDVVKAALINYTTFESTVSTFRDKKKVGS